MSIERWSAGPADAHMAEEILVDLAALVRRHPWWRARALVRALLERLGVRPPADVLDAGCGWGVTLESLEKAGFRVTGMDISRLALETLERPGRLLIEADLTQPLPLGVDRFEVVLALDVIEHLDDDRAALLERLGQLVRPGGWTIVSVPALPELFTQFDEIQGHRRRYQPETLRAAFQGSGLEIQQLFWWGQWMMPIVKWQRSRVRARAAETPAEAYRRFLQLPPWPLPWGLSLAFALEKRKAIDRKLETGTSLFAVARKPQTP